MNRPLVLACITCLSWSLGLPPALLHAADAPVNARQEVLAIGTLMTKAANLFRAKKFDECGEAIKAVMEKAEKVAATGDKNAISQLEPVMDRVEKAHGALELEGVSLPPFKKLKDLMPEDKPADPKPAPGGGNTPTPVPGTVSFVQHVAPILIGKCGQCHVQNARGRVSMATWEEIVKAKVNIVLTDIIESGQMPKGGLKVTPDELTILKKWMDAGAKFDGADEKANLVSLAPGAKPAEAPKVAVMAATGKETVSFGREIAPVLAATCTGCHGQQQPRSNFNLTTFTSFLRGGDDGVPVVPGKPGESSLVKRLKGDGVTRMPMNGQPLPTDFIAKVEKWVAEGAKFDGTDANKTLREIGAIAKAQASTHDELSAERDRVALENWRIGMPNITPEKVETPDFLMIGNVGPNTLKEISEGVEKMVPKVAEILKAPTGQPLIKGRMTIYVFGTRYDYSEFGQMIEKREIPKEVRGHWRYNIVEAYGALVPPKNNEYPVNTLIAQQLAGSYAASYGKDVPHWFAEGVGRVVASRLGASDPRVKAWDAALPSIVPTMKAPDDFMGGNKMAREDADICAYSFVKFLMGQAKFAALMDQLRKGADFDAAFGSTFGVPANAAAVWAPKAAAARPPAGKRK
jgi:hypothetical protein